MRKTVWHRLALAGLAAMVSAAAQGQAGSLSGSVDRGNARSGSSSNIIQADEGYWADEDINGPGYVLDGGRVIQRRHDPRYPRPDPRNVGRRLPSGLGLGIGSNIGSDIGVSPGIGAGIGSDTRGPIESSRLNSPRPPYEPPRHRLRDRRWVDDTPR